jgi:hypothetical protein
MPILTIEYDTDAERLQYERAIAYVREMMQLGATAPHGTAPHGTALDACEALALDRGRALLRDNLAAAVQARADAGKKSPATGRRAAGPGP